MRTRATALILPLALWARALGAQQSQCPSTLPTPGLAACNTAVDAVRAFHPLAGMIVSGGNPVLGTAGSLGGLGHLSVSARVNAIKASLPDPSAGQTPVPSSFDGLVPAPVVEAAVGLATGRHGLLSIDALGSAVVLPTSGVAKLSVDSSAAHVGSAALGIGFGARVGILGGAFPVPAVSVSWMHRTLPRLQYGSLGPQFGQGDQYEFNMDLRADNYRAVAGWKFPFVDVAAGIGIDHYTSSQTNIRFYQSPGLPFLVDTVVINPTNTREVLFADGAVQLAMLKLVAELGFQTGKDQGFATTFRDFDPKAGHVFGGIGVRFGF